MSSNIDNAYNTGAALGQSLYDSTIGTDFENFNDSEDTADIKALDYDSLIENSVPFDDVAQDAPEPVSDDIAPETIPTPNVLDNIETGADSSINRVEVSPEMRELFDSGEAEKIQAEAIDEINNSEPSPELRELMNNKTPEELKQMARDGIAESEPSPELKKLFRPIQEIPKEVILRVDDLSRRTGYPKKYIMQNLEEVAAKADEKDFEDFIATKTGPRTQEHLRYPYNRARMRNEFSLLTLEPELQKLEDLGKVYDAYSQILQMKALNPDFNDLQAQYNFWHQEYPDGVQRGKAMQEFKPYIDDLENKFWEDQEDSEQAYLRYKGMKEKGSWVPNSVFNFLTAGASGYAGTQNIVEEIGSYLTGEDIQLGKYSGDRYQKQLEVAIEMFNQDSPDNWISPEWYQRGRNILESLSTAVKGTASAGISGASVLFGLDAFSQGADAARAAGLNAGDMYDFAAREAFTEFGYNMLGGKVFGAGVESMLNKAFTDIGEKGLVQAFKEYGANGIKSALKNSGANLLEENLEEVATEVTHAVNEVLSGVDTTALSADKLLPRLKETVIQSSIMSGTPGGVEVGKALLVNRAHKNFMADMSRERMKKVDAAVKSSELLKNDPQELERYLQITVPSLKALQVDSGVLVDTYAQSEHDFEADMQELGLSPDEVRDQAELGIKATIAAPKILTSAAGRRLLETVGLDSVNEIGVESTVEARKATAQLKKDIIKIKEDIAAEEREGQVRHEFLENIADVAKFQGLYKKGDTRQMLTVWNAALESLFSRAGMKAEEFFKDVNLEVEESYARAVSNYEMGKNKYIDLSKLTERQKAAIIRARRNELAEGSAERVAAQEQEQFEKILFSEPANPLPPQKIEDIDLSKAVSIDSPEAQRFILSPTGNVDWGYINEDISKLIKRQVGAIRLQVGFHEGKAKGFGVNHIQEHSKDGKMNYELLKDVLDNYDEIRQSRGRLVLVKRNGDNANKPAFVELVVGDYYSVITQYGVRTKQLDDMTLLWSKDKGQPSQNRSVTAERNPDHTLSSENIDLRTDVTSKDDGEPGSLYRETTDNINIPHDTNNVNNENTEGHSGITTQYGISTGKRKKMPLLWSRSPIPQHAPQPGTSALMGKTHPDTVEKAGTVSPSADQQSNSSINNIPHDTENVNIENTDKGNSDEVDRLEQAEAWHGSPHNIMASLNPEERRFMLKHIGSGEGAQAFGWGLYFTSKESIARSYADALTPKDIAGVIFNQIEKIPGDRWIRDGAKELYSSAMSSNSQDLQQAYDTIKKYSLQYLLDRTEKTGDFDYVDDSVYPWEDLGITDGEKIRVINEVLKIMEQEINKKSTPRRNLYRTTLWKNKGENLLDWNGTVPNEIRNAVREHAEKTGFGFATNQPTGEKFYRNLVRSLGSPQRASMFLRDVGVDGIRYPAQSHGRGDGSKGWNYVVFDDAAIDIEEHMLYQDKDISPKNPRGWLATTKDGKKILHLSKNADASTLMHEMMHLYIDRAMMLLDSGRGSEDFRQDIQALVEFAEGVAGTQLTKNGNEKIARAFEAYLMEGKAPSPKLVGAFNSFKKWLTGIYRSIKSLNVELNDDVRGVFDRMLATEEEIERAHSQYYPLKELLVDMYEADKGKADEIRKLQKQVKTTAEEKLLRRAMKNWKLLKGGIGQIRKDARAEIEQEAVYSKDIPAAVAAGGLNLEEVTAQYGAEAAEKLKKHSSGLIKKSGSVSFDSPELFEIAAENDMSPEQFVEKLIATPKLVDKVNENVAQTIAAKEAELRQNIEEGENGDLLHSDSQLLLKMAEYDLLMNTINKQRPGLNNQHTELSAVNNAAREVLEKETSSVASCYYKYSQAEKKAGREARKTLSLAADIVENIITETEKKKRHAGKNQDTTEYKRLQDRVNLAEAVRNEAETGKRQKLEEKLRRQIQGEAATYVYREMLNHALVLEAVKAREMVKGVIKKYGRRKIDATTKNVENEYRDTIYAIARKFKLIPDGRVTTHSMTAESKSRNQINPVVGSKPVQQADNDGNVDLTQLPEQLKEMLPDDLILPDWIAREALPEGYKSVRDLTIEQVKELDQVMGELIRRGKTTLEVIKIQGAETTEEAVNASIEIMETLGDKYDRDDKLFFKTSLNKEEIKLSAKSLYDTTLNWLRRIGAHMNIMEFIAIKADGYQVLQRTHEGKKGGTFFGPMQTIVNTAAKLDAEYAEKFTKIKTDLRPHLEVLEGAKKRLAEKYGAERFKIPMLPVPEILKEKRGREYWDTEMLLMCALDLGNAKNEYALMEGYEFTPSQIEHLKHQFTSEEWTAIQGIWDTVNSLFEPLDAVNFRLTNRHLIKEEAKPFTVYTADGETIEVNGGYGPLKYDTKLSARPAQYAEVEAMLSRKSGTYTSAVGTKMGMTKARLVDEEGNPVVPYPPSLSLSAVLQPHLRDTLRVITHAEFINEVDKITSNEDWRDTFIRKFGFDNYKEVRDWIGRLARPSRKIQGTSDKVFDWIKNRNTQLALGFRFKTGVKQRLSIFNGINAMGDDGLYWLLQGYKNVGMGTGLLGTGTGVYGKDRVSEQVKAINELSPAMRVRADNISREISDYLGNLTHSKRQFNILGHKFGWDDVKETAFWWIKVNDLSAVYPLWQGAFMQAMDKNSKLGVIDRSELKDGMSEEEIGEVMQKWQKQAAEYADYIISSTQPSTLPSALSGLQSQEGILRFFTSFMTFTLKAGNRLGMYYGAWRARKISKATMIKHVMVEWIAPAMSMLGLAALCYNGDDEPEWTDWAFAVPESMLATVPLARNVSAGVKYKSPLLTLPGTERINDVFTKHDLQSFLLFAEMAAGIPAMNIYRDATKEYKKISGDKEK